MLKLKIRKKKTKKHTQGQSTGTKLVRRKVRRIKKPILYGFIAIVVCLVALFTIPKTIQNNQLKDLGYNKATITEIRKQKLTNTLIKNKYYSENLAGAINDKTLNKDYMQLYVVSDSCDQREFLLYDRMIDKGYTEEQVLSLFDSLTFYEITPLLVFDFQTDLMPYIDDCIANSTTNSDSSFTLSNSYREPYGTTFPVHNPGSYDMLVNKTFYLDSSYVPSQAVELSIRYASSGLQLDLPAADALKLFCEGAREMGLTIYASSAYRDYAHQESLYNRYVKNNGQDDADTFSARPGFSEHQTGLTIDLSAGGESIGISKFEETDEFSWTSQNCQEYGWILRYPLGKEIITGYQYEPWHYRFVGTDIAKKVASSKLTYDEYYQLYMAPWNSEENKKAPTSSQTQQNETPDASAESTDTPDATETPTV